MNWEYKSSEAVLHLDIIGMLPKIRDSFTVTDVLSSEDKTEVYS